MKCRITFKEVYLNNVVTESLSTIKTISNRLWTKTKVSKSPSSLQLRLLKYQRPIRLQTFTFSSTSAFIDLSCKT